MFTLAPAAVPTGIAKMIDWTKAPKEATHWADDRWYSNLHGGWYHWNNVGLWIMCSPSASRISEMIERKA